MGRFSPFLWIVSALVGAAGMERYSSRSGTGHASASPSQRARRKRHNQHRSHAPKALRRR